MLTQVDYKGRRLFGGIFRSICKIDDMLSDAKKERRVYMAISFH